LKQLASSSAYNKSTTIQNTPSSSSSSSSSSLSSFSSSSSPSSVGVSHKEWQEQVASTEAHAWDTLVIQREYSVYIIAHHINVMQTMLAGAASSSSSSSSSLGHSIDLNDFSELKRLVPWWVLKEYKDNATDRDAAIITYPTPLVTNESSSSSSSSSSAAAAADTGSAPISFSSAFLSSLHIEPSAVLVKGETGDALYNTCAQRLYSRGDIDEELMLV
jgi:hypothetical protein